MYLKRARRNSSIAASIGRRPAPLVAVAIALALGLASGGPKALAATYTWDAAATGVNWNSASNWGGTVPGSGDVGLFSAAAYTAQPSLSVASSIGGIWDTGAGTVTIGGTGPLTLFGTTINGNPGTGIDLDAGAGPLAINAPLVLQNNQQWIDNSPMSNGVTLTRPHPPTPTDFRDSLSVFLSVSIGG